MNSENKTTPLQRDYWRSMQRDHHATVAHQADSFVLRRSREEKHPVHDFLFTYYNFSPAKLKQWLPPLGVQLVVEASDLTEMPWLLRAGMIHQQDRLWLDADAIKPHLKELAQWVAKLCVEVQKRTPRYRCYGLHEWAMVYRQSREMVRHQGFELRLTTEAMSAFIESQSVCCSHYDAFRFFTPEARPLNVLQPTLDSRLEMEQGACLHANMDLYKWASKLWPWVGSSLIGECFALASEGRDLDMRASPYDLSHLGYEPIMIETAEGRSFYEASQRQLAEKAAPLRARLQLAAERLSG